MIATLSMCFLKPEMLNAGVRFRHKYSIHKTTSGWSESVLISFAIFCRTLDVSFLGLRVLCIGDIRRWKDLSNWMGQPKPLRGRAGRTWEPIRSPYNCILLKFGIHHAAGTWTLAIVRTHHTHFNLLGYLISHAKILRGLATRMMAGFWSFFCLIITSSYTANLAVFLLVESNDVLIKNAADLANNQHGIKYGAKINGSTHDFFKVNDYAINSFRITNGAEKNWNFYGKKYQSTVLNYFQSGVYRPDIPEDVQIHGGKCRRSFVRLEWWRCSQGARGKLRLFYGIFIDCIRGWKKM